MNTYDADFLLDFKKFLDNHVDCRVETVLTKIDEPEPKIDELETLVADLESQVMSSEMQIDELESKLEYIEKKVFEPVTTVSGIYEYDVENHEGRIINLEEQIKAVDRSELLKELTEIVEQKFYETASMSRLRVYVAGRE